jgi:hypothetical protein
MPRDPLRTYRAPDALYNEAMAAAQANGDNLNQVIRDALAAYSAKHRRRQARARAAK